MRELLQRLTVRVVGRIPPYRNYQHVPEFSSWGAGCSAFRAAGYISPRDRELLELIRNLQIFCS